MGKNHNPVWDWVNHQQISPYTLDITVVCNSYRTLIRFIRVATYAAGRTWFVGFLQVTITRLEYVWHPNTRTSYDHRSQVTTGSCVKKSQGSSQETHGCSKAIRTHSVLEFRYIFLRVTVSRSSASIYIAHGPRLRINVVWIKFE
jgi:hypothetical protein